MSPIGRRFCDVSRTALAVLCLAAMCGCSTVAIRVENVSPLEFTNVTIAGEPCEDIAPGEISDYIDVRLKFRYAVIRLTIGGYDVNTQSLNMGAKRFTHRIDVIDLAAGHLDGEVVRE